MEWLRQKNPPLSERPFHLSCVILTMLLLLTGCFMTLEQRWEAFDAERRQEIGVKTKD